MGNELIKIETTDAGEQRVNARDLYEALGIKKRFSKWFEQYQDMYVEGSDFLDVPGGTPKTTGKGRVQYVDNYSLSVDMAKHIAMMTKTDKGNQIRDYFIQVEKIFNSPEMMMARSLDYANTKLIGYEQRIAELEPLAQVGQIMEGSKDSMGVSAFAKVLNKEYGIKIGERKLYQWFRDNGWVCNTNKGGNYNLPTSKALDFGYMEVKETLYTYKMVSNNHISRTTMITPKGHNYFVKKIVNEYENPATIVGNNIKKYREKLNFSMYKLGKIADVDDANIKKYELGVHLPKLETIFKLADALDVSIEQLTGEAHG